MMYKEVIVFSTLVKKITAVFIRQVGLHVSGFDIMNAFLPLKVINSFSLAIHVTIMHIFLRQFLFFLFRCHFHQAVLIPTKPIYADLRKYRR